MLFRSLLSVSGNVDAGNIFTGGAISSVGNVDAGNVNIGYGNVNAGNVNIGGNLSVVGTMIANSWSDTDTAAFIAFDIPGNGNILFYTPNASMKLGESLLFPGNYGLFVQGANSFLSANIINGAQTINSGNTISATGNIFGGNIRTSGIVTSIDGLHTDGYVEGNTVSATSNITGGNILTGGIVSSTGNITGGNIAATNHTGTNVSVTGTEIGRAHV